nr:RNA-directed DNA polymerase, eukaryota, reverse transcriptase zinc-binding domain protein [Tanacetum cinerariifolium]
MSYIEEEEEVSLKNQTIEEEEEVHEENDIELAVDIFDDICAVKVDLVYSNIDGGVKDQSSDVAPSDSDPFGLEPLINKKSGKDLEMKGSETPNFPPGFTPTSSHNQQDGLHDHNYVQYRIGMGFWLLWAILMRFMRLAKGLVLTSMKGTILEKGIPDHRPILLKEHVVDFGTTPFRFFHSWLEMEG